MALRRDLLRHLRALRRPLPSGCRESRGFHSRERIECRLSSLAPLDAMPIVKLWRRTPLCIHDAEQHKAEEMNGFQLSNCRAPGRSRLARRDAWRRRRRPMGVPIIGRAAPTDAQAIVQARVDAWRTTYKGMISDAYLAAMKVEESAALWERILTAGATKTSVYVAEDGGEIVAFASGLMLAEPKFGLDAELSP